MTHLDHLIDGLAREKSRLADAATQAERDLRAHWIAQREREIAGERAFIGEPEPEAITDAELLAQLFA